MLPVFLETLTFYRLWLSRFLIVISLLAGLRYAFAQRYPVDVTIGVQNAINLLMYIRVVDDEIQLFYIYPLYYVKENLLSVDLCSEDDDENSSLVQAYRFFMKVVSPSRFYCISLFKTSSINQN